MMKVTIPSEVWEEMMLAVRLAVDEGWEDFAKSKDPVKRLERIAERHSPEYEAVQKRKRAKRVAEAQQARAAAQDIVDRYEGQRIWWRPSFFGTVDARIQSIVVRRQNKQVVIKPISHPQNSSGNLLGKTMVDSVGGHLATFVAADVSELEPIESHPITAPRPKQRVYKPGQGLDRKS